MSLTVRNSARQVALTALQRIEKGAFADEALHQALAHASLISVDRYFATELVYGTTRRRRTLDALIQELSTAKGDRPPLVIQLILRLGLYQLRYLDQVPPSAAVNTSVELAKDNKLGGLSGFVNGLLRAYTRRGNDTLLLPSDPVARLGVLHSYPDWIIRIWADQLVPFHHQHGTEFLGEVEALCHWCNQPPSIVLRVNPLKTTVEQVVEQLEPYGIFPERLAALPQAIRLPQHHGAIQSLPGYTDGWWTVQDSSAQLVSHLLAPQPGETVIDACAAPGGKTTHIAELMGDRGVIWACDRHVKRLKRVEENMQRLQLQSIKLLPQDMRSPQAELPQADRVLVDAPCSGLGTLHRHADARWRQSPDRISDLARLQHSILHQAAQFVKPGGVLVYATCTLHPHENEQVVQHFLDTHSQWTIAPVEAQSPLALFQTPEGWLQVWPHRHHLDGFFMVRLRRSI